MSGDGFTQPDSYGFNASYIGLLTPVGREVFRGFHATTGDEATKNYVLILPWDATPLPTKGDLIVAYDLAGNELSRFWVNFITIWRTDSRTAQATGNTIWKTEVHLEVIE